LERTLKRLYQRKTVPKRRAEVDPMVQQFYAYRDAVKDLEVILARDYIGYIE
jgi:hypothetical protein